MSFGKGFRFGLGNAVGNIVVVLIAVAFLGVGTVGVYWYLKHSTKQAVMRPINAVKDKAADIGATVSEKAGAAKKAVTDKAHEIGEKAGPTATAVGEKVKSWKFWNKDKPAEPAKQE